MSQKALQLCYLIVVILWHFTPPWGALLSYGWGCFLLLSLWRVLFFKKKTCSGVVATKRRWCRDYLTYLAEKHGCSRSVLHHRGFRLTLAEWRRPWRQYSDAVLADPVLIKWASGVHCKQLVLSNGGRGHSFVLSVDNISVGTTHAALMSHAFSFCAVCLAGSGEMPTMDTIDSYMNRLHSIILANPQENESLIATVREVVNHLER